MAAKEKSWLGMLWRPLAALLLWVLGMVPLIAAPPLLPSLTETRVGGVTAFPVDCIPAAPLYPSDLHRVCGPPLEEVASGSPVAPNSGAGRTGKQARLRELGDDPNVSSADRGWIQQEKNFIERGQRDTIRVPPGKELAHERGREAAKGYGYEHSNLQDVDLHKLQHKYDDYGRANTERPPK